MVLWKTGIGQARVPEGLVLTDGSQQEVAVIQL